MRHHRKSSRSANNINYKYRSIKSAPKKRSRLAKFMQNPWVIFIWPVASFILLQGSSAITNIRSIGNEWENFLSWVYEDANWTGVWLPAPEGYVNGEEIGIDMNGGVEPRIELVAERGMLSGIISTLNICNAFPFWNNLQVSGEVMFPGNKARIEVYDYIGGEPQKFAIIRLTKDGVAMDYEPEEGALFLFPSKKKIWLDPSAIPLGTNPGEPFCQK